MALISPADDTGARRCRLVAELSEAAETLSLEPLDLALYGGEDYALVMTFAPEDVAPPFIAIGQCVSGDGVFLTMPNGTRQKLEPRGLHHFAQG